MDLQADVRAEIDSVNTVKFNLTVDAIEAIFRTYPTGDVPCEHVHKYTVCACTYVYCVCISWVHIQCVHTVYRISRDKIMADFLVVITSVKIKSTN